MYYLTAKLYFNIHTSILQNLIRLFKYQELRVCIKIRSLIITGAMKFINEVDLHRIDRDFYEK